MWFKRFLFLYCFGGGLLIPIPWIFPIFNNISVCLLLKKIKEIFMTRKFQKISHTSCLICHRPVSVMHGLHLSLSCDCQIADFCCCSDPTVVGTAAVCVTMWRQYVLTGYTIWVFISHRSSEVN